MIPNSENAIVLDFFSGSSTTADAVIQANAVDSLNRKFIMVQLPEDLDENLKNASNDKKTVLRNAIALCDKMGKPHLLTEVAKERIRRAGTKIKEENGLMAQNLDTGFRVLKCDTSNMKEVFYKPGEVEQSFFDNYASNIKEERTPEDLLFQVMLDLGVLLSSKIEETTINSCKVFNVAEGFLYAWVVSIVLCKPLVCL